MTQETEPHHIDPDEYEQGWPDDEPTAVAEPTPARPRRRKLPPAAVGLGAIVIAGAGFIGGVQVQKSSGSESSGGMPAGMRAAMGARGAGAPDGAGSAAGASASSSSTTTGQVANVKGTKLYVTTTDGATVEVSVGSKATVQRLAKAKVGAIRPGDTVIVTGTTATSGTVRASAVQASASGVSLLMNMPGRPSAASGGSSTGSGADGASGTSGGTKSGAASKTSSDDPVDQLFEDGQ